MERILDTILFLLIGNYFGSHFIMGGERFDTPQPEAYLFGENTDLNFLGCKPTPVSTIVLETLVLVDVTLDGQFLLQILFVILCEIVSIWLLDKKFIINFNTAVMCFCDYFCNVS